MPSAFACLLLHGFSGSPFEMGPVGERLKQAGFSVVCPTLPGHCEDKWSFAGTRFADWLACAEEEYNRLHGQGKKVFVAGLSMGGSLGLALAMRSSVAGIVCLATPVFLYSWLPWRGSSYLLPFVPWLKHFRPFIETPAPSRESNEIAPHQGYEGFQALHPLSSLLQGLQRVRTGLEQVRAPLLVMHSPQDVMVPLENAWEILTRVSSPIRRLHLLPIQERITSRHVLTTHRETRDEVSRACSDFFLALAAQG